MALTKADDFEGRLRHIDRLALAGALLHKATAWLGAGALTWSTVVLMGGFASAVSISDFKLITLLVVLIVFLLALSLFSVKYITKKTLCSGSIDPTRYKYHDGRLGFVTRLEIASHLVQLVFISICLWKACTRIRRSDFRSMNIINIFFHNTDASPTPTPSTAALQDCLETCFSAANYHSAATMAAICAQACIASASASSNNNLQVCLFSFFLLVIATSSCAALCLIYRWVVKPLFWWKLVGDRNCLSLRRYHDEVLSRALNLGFAEGEEFDGREFLLRALGEDLMIRNIAPLEVRNMNQEVIEYLYNHPKGPEMVYQGLTSGDTLLQQAAANIVGFWAESDLRLDGHLELLSKLATKLGLPGKAAEGAANSFRAVAYLWSGEKKESRPEPNKAPRLQPVKEPSPLLSVRISRSGVAPEGGAAAPPHAAAIAAPARGAVVPERGASSPADGLAEGGRAAAPGGKSSTTADDGEAAAGENAAPADGVLVGGGAAVLVDGAASREGAAVRGAVVPGGRAMPDGGAAAGGGAESEGAAVPADGAALGGGAVVAEEGALPADEAAALGGGGDGGGDAVASDQVEAAAGWAVAGGAGGGATSGGGAAGPGADGYNVVDRVVDLILQKRAPTLLVYVRTLESFLMSASIRQYLSLDGRQKTLEKKLIEGIIGNSTSGMEPRTKLLALFALRRLKSSDGMQIEEKHKKGMKEQLDRVDEQFTNHVREAAAGTKVIFVTERDKYIELSKQLGNTIRGGWLTRCTVNGEHLVACDQSRL